ncbi:MAG: DNA mismatch repair protein MutS [Eubacterium sp.]|nr:DNA mismatch repair protein MutS [Eubacterium sp.]
MKQGSNRRLANVKTRSETGFDYVRNGLELMTPFAQKLLKELRPFFPGEEDDLRQELDRVERMTQYAASHERLVGKMQEVFMCMKDLSYSIQRCGANTLSVVELFEIKTQLLEMTNIRKLCLEDEKAIPEELIPYDVTAALDILDPRKDRLNTFYIYNDFSDTLAELRKKKHDYEVQIRRAQKARKEEIRKQYGIVLTPKFDVILSKGSEELETALKIEDLEQISEDYMTVTFQLGKSEDIYELDRQMDGVIVSIEEEELRVRKELSARISRYEKILLENCSRIGELEFTLAKAIYGIRHNCVKPEITEEHVIVFKGGRHLQVEDILRAKGKQYHPIGICLKNGVTCITGANMGGKTISLKLAGLVPMLAQYGFFVPCTSAKIGLSNYMQILIGDSQSVERGLSSFGSEMEELKEILDRSQDRSFILIDEIASGTNPVEGLALTKSLIDYLREKPYISLITTHFDAVKEEPDIVNMQVRGLANADFRKLDSELRRANRRERINIISKYMDYSLYEVQGNREIPRDALNIARMLGLNEEIIEGAKKYIK